MSSPVTIPYSLVLPADRPRVCPVALHTWVHVAISDVARCLMSKERVFTCMCSEEVRNTFLTPLAPGIIFSPGRAF